MSDKQEVSTVVVSLYGEFSHHVWIAERIANMLKTHGDLVEGVDYDVTSGFVDDPKLHDTGSDASSKQVWFLSKCVDEAKVAYMRADNKDEMGNLATAIDVATQESRSAVSKSRASQLIDALKALTLEAKCGQP
jgi:hypothetical protein